MTGNTQSHVGANIHKRYHITLTIKHTKAPPDCLKAIKRETFFIGDEVILHCLQFWGAHKQ